MNNFKGDTPPKKCARLELHFDVQEILGPRYKNARQLFLAGPEAGDVSVALGLGAKPKNLVAVDRDKNTATKAKWRFPEVRIEHCDVLDIIEEQPGSFDFIFLDFCNQITENNLDTVALAAVEGLKHKEHSLIACTFMTGRENDVEAGSFRSRILVERAKLEKEINKLAPWRKELWLKSLSMLARVPIISQELLHRTRTSSCIVTPISLFFYVSPRKGQSGGMPICTYFAKVVKCNRYSIEKYAKEALEYIPEFHFFSETDKELGLHAVRLIEQGHDPSLVLNVSKGTVAAWRANATRGAYEN